MKTAALIWGVIFLFLGFLGMVPETAPNGMLFGLFRVDGLHNAVHLITGIVALLVALSGSGHASRVYFQVVGIIYAALTLLGLFYGNRSLLGIIAHNVADVWLHALVAIASLYLGYFWGRMPSHLNGTSQARA